METFGAYIKRMREIRGIGLREMARLVGISPPYLSDIEQDKREAPSKEVIIKMNSVLESNLEHLYDLAGLNSKKIPPDLPEIIKDYPELSKLIRAVKNRNLSSQQILRIAKDLEQKTIKAIIVAAGRGARMKHLTEDLPKCMLEFGGKTLLERQIEALTSCGITDISVVRGYKKEKINYPGLKYYVNDRFDKNNVLCSLFYAEEEMDDEVVISYSDILYEKEVVERLLEGRNDISIVVDIEWLEYYKDRKDHPIEEAENVIFDAENKVVEIGKILTNKHDVHGEFVGLMKLTKRGADIFKRNFNRSKGLFWGKPFVRANTFENAYLTDMLQELILLGVDVYCVIIERGWREIDTVEDYENALKAFEG
jgi:choline kinase/DNA-binding XRE family transcriptional regulator